MFADDAELFFNSRDDPIEAASFLYEYLLKFGLKMHIGTGVTPSKAEAMYSPTPRRLYSDDLTKSF
jgi:hypothetical protein